MFDEVQRAPALFSYLQEEVDRDPSPGRFILTGSQHFGLTEADLRHLQPIARLMYGGDRRETRHGIEVLPWAHVQDVSW